MECAYGEGLKGKDERVKDGMREIKENSRKSWKMETTVKKQRDIVKYSEIETTRQYRQTIRKEKRS